ncbi:hypothetical protein L6452_44389 [Arctium lappa]|uniref:Uncharacterized protein n=1 Tax=Arctium lappa TaxID=4217 RepID=A0ACB8XF53_ARCLA|nr:hypothetical protein L6452_44389 [Arctium lappa]
MGDFKDRKRRSPTDEEATGDINGAIRNVASVEDIHISLGDDEAKEEDPDQVEVWSNRLRHGIGDDSSEMRDERLAMERDKWINSTMD